MGMPPRRLSGAKPAVDWFVLRSGRFEPLAPACEIYRSEAFPGLWLHAQAVLHGDLALVLQGLEQGLASPEHAAFAASLPG